MKYNLLFSIPVHEEEMTVMDQIININHFNPDCAIILHISKKMIFNNYNIFFNNIKNIGNVFVNDERLDTSLCGILDAHLSNFKYASKNIEFDYIVFLSSNELFIKPNSYEYIKNYNYSSFSYYPNSTTCIENSNSYFKRAILDDPMYLLLKKEINFNSVLAYQIEGSFYKKEIFSVIYEKIIKISRTNQNKVKYYPKEEIYINPIAKHFFGSNYNGMNITYVNWKRCYSNYKNPLYLYASINEIKDLKIKQNNIYSVKRIDRKLNSYTRIYIREKITKPEDYQRSLINCPALTKQRLNKIIMMEHWFFAKNNIKNFVRKVFKKL